VSEGDQEYIRAEATGVMGAALGQRFPWPASSSWRSPLDHR
jgi:hypothetical protein